MSEPRVLHVRSRFASVAPDTPIRENNRLPSEIDTLFVRYGSWCRSRRAYGAPRVSLESTLAPLRVKSTAPVDGPTIVASRELAVLHQAVMGLTDRQRFALEACYVLRLRPAIRVAEAIGVSRVHYYRVLRSAALEAHAAHLVILRQPV